jgi:hypothetical protein
MRRECAWCGAIIDTSDIIPVSHGICRDCVENFFTCAHVELGTIDDRPSHDKDNGHNLP